MTAVFDWTIRNAWVQRLGSRSRGGGNGCLRLMHTNKDGEQPSSFAARHSSPAEQSFLVATVTVANLSAPRPRNPVLSVFGPLLVPVDPRSTGGRFGSGGSGRTTMAETLKGGAVRAS